MNSTKEYRLLTGRHSMGGKVYAAGTEDNILTLTEEQAKKFDEGRLEEVSGKGSKDTTTKGPKADLINRLSSLSEDQLRSLVEKLDGNSETETNLDTDTETNTDTNTNTTDSESEQKTDNEIDVEALLSGSIPEIKTEVKRISSLDDLDTIYQAESNGRQRTGVFNLLIERKNELEGK